MYLHFVIPTVAEGSAVSFKVAAKVDHEQTRPSLLRLHRLQPNPRSLCGMTNSVARRTEQHRAAAIPGFTADYRCHRLVWFEHYQYVHNALDREKRIKRWTRAKKIHLIEEMNPSWADLSEVWREETANPSASLRSE